MRKSIDLGIRKIKYELERKPVKNINLRIKADRTVFVSAAEDIPEEIIDKFLLSKAEYICSALKHYEEIAKYSPKPKQYIDGETIKFFGREQRLIVREGKKNSVMSDESYITLTVKNLSDFALKKKTMDKWLQGRCRETVQAICEAIYPKFQKYGVEFPQIRFREMVSRWGSCQPKRKILTFNYALIDVPITCIEYVVTHEFVHFMHPNHSKKFYIQLAMFMPDWEQRKRVLEKTMGFDE